MSGIDAPSTGMMGGESVRGANLDVAQAALNIDIWLLNTAYTGQPTSVEPEALEVFSTSDDDDVNGIGVQRVSLEVLRTVTSKAWETIEADMDGTAPVALGSFYRARNLRGIQFGSSGTQVGSLRVEDGSTNAYSYMPVGYNKAQECVYTVPAGLPIDIRSIDIQVSRADGSQSAVIVALGVREFGSGGFEHVNTFNVQNQDPQNVVYAIPLRIPPLADVKLIILDASQTSQITGTINFGP